MESEGEPTKDCSKASMDDHDHESTDDNIPSSRKFYECIFCKRGFSTAQALGGHMNIHRKDRAKMKHSPSDAKLGDHDHHNYDHKEGEYEFYNNHRTSFNPHVSDAVNSTYSMFFDPTYARESIRREKKLDAIGPMRTQELSLFGGDFHDDGERHAVLGHEERMELRKEAEAIDLELRLGHEP